MQPPTPLPPEDAARQEDTSVQDKEQRRRKLREELLAFLEKLKPWCGRFETIDEWWEFLRPFDRWLEGAKDDLTPEQYRRLKRYVQWTEQGREALKLACKSLSRELAAIAEDLALGATAGTAAAAAGGGFAGWVWMLMGLVATAAVFWGGWQIWQLIRPREGAVVEVRSENCPPVDPPLLTPEVREGFRALGIPYPQEPLTEDQPWVFPLPAQIHTMEVLRTEGALLISVEVAGGITWTWEIPWEENDSIWFWKGGIIEPGRPESIPLEPGTTVELLVRCP